jgi:hypothetical protein
MKALVFILVLLQAGLAQAQTETDCTGANIYIDKASANLESVTKALDLVAAGENLQSSIRIMYPFSETQGEMTNTILIEINLNRLEGVSSEYIEKTLKPKVERIVSEMASLKGIHASCLRPDLSGF